MSKNTGKSTMKREARVRNADSKSFMAAAEDPLSFLFERHRHNPFASFLRAAFFYGDDDGRLAHDRAGSRKSLARGDFHGGALRY